MFALGSMYAINGGATVMPAVEPPIWTASTVPPGEGAAWLTSTNAPAAPNPAFARAQPTIVFALAFGVIVSVPFAVASPPFVTSGIPNALHGSISSNVSP